PASIGGPPSAASRWTRGSEPAGAPRGGQGATDCANGRSGAPDRARVAHRMRRLHSRVSMEEPAPEVPEATDPTAPAPAARVSIGLIAAFVLVVLAAAAAAAYAGWLGQQRELLQTE